MGASINFNYETYHLYQNLIADMMDAQTEEGMIPGISPEYVVFGDAFRDSDRPDADCR
ncbi:MAG: hypothetical protein JW723_04785 [Bacteroidales bacterium]|nr:hypothetical protein [Bacteroidales bacterium]